MQIRVKPQAVARYSDIALRLCAAAASREVADQSADSFLREVKNQTLG